MYLVFLQEGEVWDSFPADLQSCGVYAGDLYSTRRNYGNWNKQEDTVVHSDSNHYHHYFAHLKTFLTVSYSLYYMSICRDRY